MLTTFLVSKRSILEIKIYGIIFKKLTSRQKIQNK